MNQSLLHLLLQEAEWTSNFDDRSLQRAGDYARRQRVVSLQFSAGENNDACTLEGVIRGTAKQPYDCRIELRAQQRALTVASQCSCPVGSDCKHAAAMLLLAANLPPESWPGAKAADKPAAKKKVRVSTPPRKPAKVASKVQSTKATRIPAKGKGKAAVKPPVQKAPAVVKAGKRKPTVAKVAAPGSKRKAESGKRPAAPAARKAATPTARSKAPAGKPAHKSAPARPSTVKGRGKPSAVPSVKSTGVHGRLAVLRGKDEKSAAAGTAVTTSKRSAHTPVVRPGNATLNAPGTAGFKGRIASATAMVAPRPAKAAANGGSHKHSKNPSDSMNKSAATNFDDGVTREDGRYALPATTSIDLPHTYVPGNEEEYMGPRQLAYFRDKLRTWRGQLVEESRQTMDNLRGEVRDVGDEAERATRETENSLELRTRDRYRKLIAKIDKALRRIEDGSYGFCEETDEEIGIERLDARPIATLSLDAQERREHMQKQMGD